MPSTLCYQLGNTPTIIFTPATNSLSLEGEQRRLEPLQSRLLAFLVENQGQVLSAREIAGQVWRREQVSDNLVRQVISQLRGHLGDQRPYAMIKTIPRQGYVFDVGVTAIQPEPPGGGAFRSTEKP